ncbi:hypothetical protein ACIPSE_24545 [Streptomyces sp. NPDC090106]|uniref:hypothetical protein n=1 Tax=Streptomyces sp. NPDC090106 TaxID=3365946 RepID=UPI0038151632
MEWTGILSTALGAVIALGTSAYVEHRRWSRESAQRAREERRAGYVAFLDATAQASETLVNIARGHDRAEDTTGRAGTVLRDSSVLSRRLELALVAPDDIMAEVTEAVALLRVYRDAVAQGLPYESDEVQAARAAFNDHRSQLTRLMRTSL